MISGHDVDSFTDLLLIVRNPWVLLAILVATCFLIYLAISDSNECSRKVCDQGATPRIVGHECLCTSRD